MIRRVVFFVLVLALAACGDDEPTTPTSPSTPPPTVTETFTGTVNQNGARTHNFATQASGNVTATLTAVGPDAEVVVGFSLGTWNGSVCQIILAKDNAKQGDVINGGVSSFGQLCVRIYDVGNIPATQPLDYELQVVHP